MSSKHFRPRDPDLEQVSLDGTKVEANASKHKAMSYGRMEGEVERLEREIREYAAKEFVLQWPSANA